MARKKADITFIRQVEKQQQSLSESGSAMFGLDKTKQHIEKEESQLFKQAITLQKKAQ